MLCFAAPASADIVMPMPIARPALTARLVSVQLGSASAPTADASRVEREARAVLARSQARITRCLSGVDLRRDPLRSGARTLRGRLVFNRSARGRLQIDHTRGFPRAARRCVEEALSGLAVRTSPRGSVEVRFSYRIGS